MTPAERADLVAASPLFSARWWSHLTGRSFGDRRAAAADYVRLASAGRRRFPPHPLVVRRWLASHGSATPRGEDPLTWWLTHHAGTVGCHPLLPPGVPVTLADGSDPDQLADRVIAWLQGPGDDPRSGPGTVVAGVGADEVAVLELLAALHERHRLVVALGDASEEVVAALAAARMLSPGLRLLRCAWSRELALQVADPGEPVLLVAPDTRDLTGDGAQALLDAGVAQPLVLDDTGLVRSAGASADGTPGLVGTHPRDVRDTPAWSAARLAAPVLAGPAGVVAGPRTDLPVLVVPTVTVRGEPALELTGAGPDRTPGPVPRPTRLHERPPRLRWTLDTAVRWVRREHWGDWHFARSLAAALERLGQHVAVDGREARPRGTRELDDVLLAIRGLDEVAPAPGVVSLLWVISHPDLVTAREASAFDRVFAASRPWAEDRSREWGVRVDPLLQCTDAGTVSPQAATPDTGPALLFIGNARPDGPRPVLEWARQAGLDVAVYGGGWGDRLPEGWLRGTSVPNAGLAAAYGSAGVVLNDHHEDMRAAGFVSNRLFDAVASGARVVSDPVAGAAGLFGGSVVEVDGPRGLLHAVRTLPFPDRQARLGNAAAVLADHSFDARARQLLDAALGLGAAR